MATEVIKREEMLLKCGHKRCSSHVFLLHLNENGRLIIICHLCKIRQKAHELKRGNVPLKNIKQSEENAKKEKENSTS